MRADRYFVTTSIRTSFGVVDCLEARRGNPCPDKASEGKAAEKREIYGSIFGILIKNTDYLWYYLARRLRF
jgi:hypothetical protein